MNENSKVYQQTFVKINKFINMVWLYLARNWSLILKSLSRSGSSVRNLSACLQIVWKVNIRHSTWTIKQVPVHLLNTVIVVNSSVLHQNSQESQYFGYWSELNHLPKYYKLNFYLMTMLFYVGNGTICQ